MDKQQPYDFTSCTIELTPEQSILCQSLACSLYGDKSKVENIIKDALECYDVRTKETAKDNTLLDKLSGMILVSGFETTIMQSMLKEIYCRDKKTIAKYESIRNAAVRKMTNQFDEVYAGKNLELQEAIRTLNQEMERLSAKVHTLTQEKTILQERYQQVCEKFTTSERNYNDIAIALKSYIELNQWQEQRVKEAPKIKKKNSGLLKAQSWESAIKEFENYNQKPNVPQIDIK